MPANQPIIKFSPFEALLIGEKNSVLKRQPMKNTIFVSRLNRQCKAINLRVLFGLDKHETETNDVIFKMPQRVQDFLKNRKKTTKDIRGCSSKKEILYYEFEGRKISETVTSKKKKSRCRADFNRKGKNNDKYKNKAVRKFPQSTRNNYVKIKAFLKKKFGGKFKSKPKCASPKEKHLASYVLYLKEDGQNVKGERVESRFEKPEETVPNVEFDAVGNHVSEESLPDLEIPKTSKVLNFDEDRNLLDIVYENFPEKVKFESKSVTNDFSEDLVNAGLVNENDYASCVKNGVLKNEFSEILKSPFPLVRCQRLNNTKPNQCIVIGRCRPDIDEEYLKKNHIIKSKSLRRFYFNGVEGKGVFNGKSPRPKKVQNSCLGSLPQL